MARPAQEDSQTLRMALVGYDIEHQRITDKIAEITGLLNGNAPVAIQGESEPTKRKRRKISAAARKRIGDATRRRWAALRKAKAAK
jgi:hypothetical protein